MYFAGIRYESIDDSPGKERVAVVQKGFTSYVAASAVAQARAEAMAQEHDAKPIVLVEVAGDNPAPSHLLNKLTGQR